MAEILNTDDIEGNSPTHAVLQPGMPGVHRRGGIFQKYTNEEKGLILWKITLAMTIFGFVVALTGVAIDRFDNQEEVDYTLNGFAVVVPSYVMRATSVELGTDGCESWKVDPLHSNLHSRKGMSFSDLRDGGVNDPAAQFFIKDSARLISTVNGGQFQEFYMRGISARVFSISAVVLQGLAIVWAVVHRGIPPSGFFYNRPLFGQSTREHHIGSFFHMILLLSGILLLFSLGLICSFRAALLSRIANFSLDWCAGSPFDALPRGRNELVYMQFLGDFIQSPTNSAGVSFYAFAISMFIIYAQVLLVFYVGIRQTASSVFTLPNSQLRALPWYARIPSMKFSVALILVAVVANCASSFSARVRGYPINIHYYNITFLENVDSQSWSLSDVFLDRIHRYVLDNSLNKMMLAAWLPFMCLIGFGSVDIWRYMSKAVQLLGILIMGSAICGIVTVPPTPSSVLQKPQCFRQPQNPPSFAQFFSVSESCNDVMYSLFSVLITLPVMFVAFYVRYGPIRRKQTAYACLAISTICSLFCLIATRQYYSVDVYIGAVVTVLLSLSQSAAFKLLFRFGVVHAGMRHKAPIVLSETIVPALEDLINRFELFYMAADSNISQDQLSVIKAEFDILSESVEFARAKALLDLNEKPDDDTISNDTTPSRDELKKDL